MDELLQLPLIEQEVPEGMKAEMSQLETLEVLEGWSRNLPPEDEGRELAKKTGPRKTN